MPCFWVDSFLICIDRWSSLAYDFPFGLFWFAVLYMHRIINQKHKLSTSRILSISYRKINKSKSTINHRKILCYRIEKLLSIHLQINTYIYRKTLWPYNPMLSHRCYRSEKVFHNLLWVFHNRYIVFHNLYLHTYSFPQSYGGFPQF